MNIRDIFSDKNTKPKEKIEMISYGISTKELSTADLISYASAAKDPEKASCIEALEFASKERPALINATAFDFVVACLHEKAPRIKWESAKVVGNTAHLFPTKLDEAISALLKNSNHSGTVVRWATAFALGEIMKQNTRHNKMLIPAAEAIINKEEKTSIKKIYQASLKSSR